jgi:quercetin dioxygenase-like cupin family protein
MIPDARIAPMQCRVLFLLALAAVTLAAQSSPEVEITAEPHHHLALQNKYVRVFKVEVPPHEATLMHRHHYDYAYVNLGPVELANDVEGQPPATLKLQHGETRFSPGNFAHAVRDLASTPFRNITIELLQHPQSHKPAPWPEKRGLQILSAGTQDILFVRDGVRASDVQLNPGGTLPKDSHARAQLIVGVSQVKLRSAAAGIRPENIEMTTGDFQWLGSAHTLVNAGKQPARFISFEFR